MLPTDSIMGSFGVEWKVSFFFDGSKEITNKGWLIVFKENIIWKAESATGKVLDKIADSYGRLCATMFSGGKSEITMQNLVAAQNLRPDINGVCLHNYGE